MFHSGDTYQHTLLTRSIFRPGDTYQHIPLTSSMFHPGDTYLYIALTSSTFRPVDTSSPGPRWVCTPSDIPVYTCRRKLVPEKCNSDSCSTRGCQQVARHML